MTNEFIALLERNNEPRMLDFLRKIGPAERKALVPELKRTRKEYTEFGEVKRGMLGVSTMGYKKGSDGQRKLLEMAAFVCCNRTDYERSVTNQWVVDTETMEKVLDWYCPPWFGDYINNLGKREFIPRSVDYPWIMSLRRRGLLQPSPELIVMTLPNAIFYLETKPSSREWLLTTAPLFEDPVTLEEHLWYLFEQPSLVHARTVTVDRGGGKIEQESGWSIVLKDLVTQGRVDRFRVLKEALQASGHHQQAPAAWFADLFLDLQPTTDELMRLQKELFTVLGASQSKPVNVALRVLKHLVTEEGFDGEGLLDMMPVLLTADSKATINSALMLMEKLGQRQPVHRGRIALLACQCFVRNDGEVQTRAAKLIAKIGDVSDEELRRELVGYREAMRSEPKKVLNDFLVENVSNELVSPGAGARSEPIAAAEPLREIPFPTSFDDFIFLASQAFDNNEPWHFDLLPAALIHHSPRLQASQLPLLEPAFQRATKTIFGPNPASTGQLDVLLANFFIDWGHWLFRQFPADTQCIRDVYLGTVEDERIKWPNFFDQPYGSSFTAGWRSAEKLDVYVPLRSLLEECLQRIEAGDGLPPLSTPTHAPCWVDAGVLIRRLHLYQQAGKAPGMMDLQIALSRIRTDDAAAALRDARERLQGEVASLVAFVLDDHAVPLPPFENKGAWFVAGLSRRDKKQWPAFESFAYNGKPFTYYTGEFAWKPEIESFVRKEYDYKARRHLEIPDTRKRLFIEKQRPVAVKEAGSILKKFFSRLRTSVAAEAKDGSMLYDELQFRRTRFPVFVEDVTRIMGLVPNNPGPVIADVIERFLRYPVFDQPFEARVVGSVVRCLHNTWEDPGEAAYLFLGLCMVSVDKTIGMTAAEIWIREAVTGAFDNVRLGSVLGELERMEFAPMKRLTDLLGQTLHRISPQHDRALRVLVGEILVRQPDEPVKGLKRLLEIYVELKEADDGEQKAAGVARERGQGQDVPEGVRAKLGVWAGNSGLKKLVGQLSTFLICFLFMLGVGMRVNAQAERERFSLVSYEGRKVNVRVKPLGQERLIVSCPTDTLRLYDCWSVDTVKLLNPNFLEIDYSVRGGSGFGLGNTLLLALKGGKLRPVLCARTFMQTVGPDGDDSTSSAVNLTGDRWSNYELMVTTEIYQRDTTSKGYLSAPGRRHSRERLHFDTWRMVFCSGEEVLSRSMRMGRVDDKELARTLFNPGDRLPVAFVGDTRFYYSKGQWYERSEDGEDNGIVDAEVFDTLLALPEVRRKNAFIDSLTGHEHGITMVVKHFPEEDQSKRYDVQVGYDDGRRLKVYYNYAVYRPDYRVVLIDK